MDKFFVSIKEYKSRHCVAADWLPAKGGQDWRRGRLVDIFENFDLFFVFLITFRGWCENREHMGGKALHPSNCDSCILNFYLGRFWMIAYKPSFSNSSTQNYII